VRLYRDRVNQSPSIATAAAPPVVFEICSGVITYTGIPAPRAAFMSALVQVIAEPIVPLSLALAIILGSRWRAVVASLTINAALLLAPIVFLISWRLFRTFERMTALTLFGEESST
jgi:hypothetical protein